MRLTANPRALLAAAGLLLAVSLTSPAVADTITPLTPPVPMPAFKIPGISGTSGSDADLRNKVTIIRFWASW
ncbi:MAG: hypothetical protein Q8L40_03790 [Burkholderiales bacterium]|nr:hypothetical protein [Burkholderiales bacterium]